MTGRLRDDARKDKQVISYLESENSYTNAVLKDTEEVQELLYKEMRGRIKEADQSTATRWVEQGGERLGRRWQEEGMGVREGGRWLHEGG